MYWANTSYATLSDDLLPLLASNERLVVRQSYKTFDLEKLLGSRQAMKLQTPCNCGYVKHLSVKA